MPRVLDPFRFVLVAVGGWMNQHQLQIIDYLREENRFFVNNSAGGACGSTTISALWVAAIVALRSSVTVIRRNCGSALG